MLSWQARILNGFFRFTMKRHGKKPLNVERLRKIAKSAKERPLGAGRIQGGKSAIRPGPELRRGRFIDTSLMTGIEHCSVLARRGLYFWVPPDSPPGSDRDGGCFSRAGLRPRLSIGAGASLSCGGGGCSQGVSMVARPSSRGSHRAGGDSAGAGLAIATALGVRDSGLPQTLRRSSVFLRIPTWRSRGASVESNGRTGAMSPLQRCPGGGGAAIDGPAR